MVLDSDAEKVLAIKEVAISDSGNEWLIPLVNEDGDETRRANYLETSK